MVVRIYNPTPQKQLKQECHKSKASLGYTVSARPAKIPYKDYLPPHQKKSRKYLVFKFYLFLKSNHKGYFILLNFFYLFCILGFRFLVNHFIM